MTAAAADSASLHTFVGLCCGVEEERVGKEAKGKENRRRVHAWGHNAMNDRGLDFAFTHLI